MAPRRGCLGMILIFLALGWTLHGVYAHSPLNPVTYLPK